MNSAFVMRWLTGLVCFCGWAEIHAKEMRFERDVLPLLSAACFQCHGPDAAARKGDLRLDTREGWAEVDVEDVLGRLVDPDPDERMPPPESGKVLLPADIADIREWISKGAEWSEHWAFRPMTRPAVPTGHIGEHPIDAFIGAAQASRGLESSAEADKFTLIRRLYIDLIGLPPSPEEIATHSKRIPIHRRIKKWSISCSPHRITGSGGGVTG